MYFICINNRSEGLNFRLYFGFFTSKLLLKKQTYVSVKRFFFWSYLSQFLSYFENLLYRYNRKNKIFKLSTYSHWLDRYLKDRFLRPQSLSRHKLALIWLRGLKMPLKDWVSMIDLWPIVISIPLFQNKSACLPPLKTMNHWIDL